MHIQYNTIQYNTIQYNTIQYNTTQHNTMRDAMQLTGFATPYNNPILGSIQKYNMIIATEGGN